MSEYLSSWLRREVYFVFGLPFDSLGFDSALLNIKNRILEGRRSFLSTPNLNFLIASGDNRDLFFSVVRSDVSIIDGFPVLFLARSVGLPFRERVPGSSMFDKLMRLNDWAYRPLKIFFFGGADDSAQKAAAAVNKQLGNECAGHYNPGFCSVSDMSSPDVISIVNSKPVDFLVVSLGAEKGQSWISNNIDLLKNVTVVSHLGAVVNFVAGTVERAPFWAQKFCLEWLWRIKEEPYLWRRYFRDGKGLVSLVVFNWFGVFNNEIFLRYKMSPPNFVSVVFEGRGVVRVGGGVCADNVNLFIDELLKFEKATSVHFDLTKVDYFDSRALGLLCCFFGWASRNKVFVKIDCNDYVKKVFRMYRATYLLDGVN